MKYFEFERKTQIAQVSLQDLLRRVEQPDADTEQLIKETVAELSASLEELQVAQEELQQQNEELLTTRQQLETERQHYRDLFAFAPDGYLVTDAQGIIQEANRAASSLFGVNRDRLSGKPLVLFVGRGGQSDFYDRISRVQAGEEDRRGPWRIQMQSRGGKPFAADVTWAPIYTHDGHLTGLRWIIRDISRRVAAEQALQKTIQQLQAFMEHSPALVNVFDEEGRYRLVSSATADLLGRPLEEVVGKTFHDLLPPEIAAAFMSRVEKLRKTQSPLVVSDRVVLEGEERWFETLLFPLATDHGEPTTYGSIATDVTERKRAEAQIERYAAELERSNEELEQFAHIISHDLREPLRMISSYLDLLERHCGDDLDAEARTFMDYALDGARRMREMIRALLDLSRVESQGEPLIATNVDVVLQHVLAVLDPLVEETGAEVTCDPLPTVMADETQLAQVFQNLIANAIKFRQAEVPPRVRVSAERRGEARLFSVADNGIGIDPRQAERIFLIFQRLHTDEEYPGTGVGLALCRRIVERHGGRIWVESEPGRGATFYFTLPAA